MRLAVLSALLALVPEAVSGQWTHRYPKLEGYSHHVYVEGFELPTLVAGPTDPAPSPDGTTIAIAARGWIWLLDTTSGVARRLTRGPAVDSRPAWHPDGTRLAFLRDDSERLTIWSIDVATREETLLFEDDSIVLDPAWAPDGDTLYFSAATEGDLDIWRLSLETGEPARVTERRGLEVRPQPLPGGGLAYLSKGRSSPDAVIVRDASGAESSLRAESIASQARPGAAGDRAVLALNWPAGDGGDGYRLMLLDPEKADPMELVAARGLPLTPAFTADGASVIYTEADENERFRLRKISTRGGPVTDIPVRAWDFGTPLARVRIITRRAGDPSPVPARLEVLDPGGHPAVVPGVFPRFDGTHGRIYFYSPGVVEVEVPAALAGEVRITATHGFGSLPATASVTVSPGETAEADLVFEPLWDARAAGYRSADHHFHLNYGGVTRLSPDDLELLLAGEDMDLGTPLMANLHHRRNDTEFFADRRVDGVPAILFGQEIRSHFLGHLGLIGIESVFWPWFWGPGYPIYEADDRPNLDALAHSRGQAGVSAYMHPVSRPDPFGSAEGLGAIPIMVIPDAVLGDLDTLEVACLWTNEFGTADLWHRFLNLGIPLAASAGTDVMLDYHRTMAVGTTRIYVHAPGPFRIGPYLDALRAGKSFVTTGPLLDFVVEGERPGGAVAAGGEAAWTLTLASTGAVGQVDLLVNGEVVETVAGLEGPGVRELSGAVALPAGGWVAARAHGGEEAWPGMNGSVFAQTSPVWVGEVGSRDPAAADAAARDLLRALDLSETEVRERYDGVPIPRILERFTLARERLQEFLR
jgi:TolB protein